MWCLRCGVFVVWCVALSLKDELKLITNKQIPQEIDNENLDYQNNNVSHKKNLDLTVQNNFSSSSVSLKRKEAGLVLETQIIIDKLLTREDLASTSNVRKKRFKKYLVETELNIYPKDPLLAASGLPPACFCRLRPLVSCHCEARSSSIHAK